MANDALISVLEITNRWLSKKGKTHHSWYKAAPLACEAVQELGFTSMPILRHIEIKKTQDQTWFEIPAGYADWVSVGIRIGNRWFPVGVTDNLMPYPNANCAPDEYSDSYNQEFSHSGDWKSWLNTSCEYITKDFFDEDFDKNDYSEENTTKSQPEPTDWQYSYLWPFGVWNDGRINAQGESVSGKFSNAPRVDEVTFNVERGIIMVPDGFPSNALYLVYVGFGTADTMTFIPLKAQAVIEAYIDWQYHQNNRNTLSQAKWFKAMYDEQHRLYRARNNDLTTTVVRRIVDRGYIRDAAWGSDLRFGSGQTQTTVIYYNYQFLILTAFSAGTSVIATDLVGKKIAYVVKSDVIKQSGYEMQGNLLVFTDGSEFEAGEKIVVYYES